MSHEVMLRWCSRVAEMVHAHHLMMVSRDTSTRCAADFRDSAATPAGAPVISRAFQMMLDVLLSPRGRGWGPSRSDGKVRGLTGTSAVAINPLTLPRLRRGSLPLPQQGERARHG